MDKYPRVLVAPAGNPVALAWQQSEGNIVKEVNHVTCS